MAPDIRTLYGHPVYAELKTPEHVRVLMRSHVFAVWDFMSLVKALQRRLTCTEVPWLPPPDPELSRFINEIVLGEESDQISPDLCMSHCELYLRAMSEIGADARPFARFQESLRAGQAPEAALASAQPPAYVKDFVLETLKTAREPAHAVAAAFVFGREDVIPGMFRKILSEVSAQGDSRLDFMRLYLERHIEIDGDSHGPLAARLLSRLCAEDASKWRQAKAAARRAIAARLRFWDGVLREIRSGARAGKKREASRDAESPAPRSARGRGAVSGGKARLVLVQPPSYDWITPSNGLALLQAHSKKAGFPPVIVDSSTRVRKALSAALKKGFST
ncbi:MAG: DUF3050 domain-containing protein, partial [Elusimicrobia bacterium]|nr:DUF3050 domain-containing protein [Elusimicrobiota bacterium]